MSRFRELIQRPGIWQVCLAVYWLSLLVATHIPGNIPSLQPSINDKVAHFFTFALLGVLLTLTWAVPAGRLKLRHLLWAWLVLAIYGVLDECTQPLVSRGAEVWDWVADVTGAGLGILLAAVVFHKLINQRDHQ